MNCLSGWSSEGKLFFVYPSDRWPALEEKTQECLIQIGLFLLDRRLPLCLRSFRIWLRIPQSKQSMSRGVAASCRNRRALSFKECGLYYRGFNPSGAHLRERCPALSEHDAVVSPPPPIALRPADQYATAHRAGDPQDPERSLPSLGHLSCAASEGAAGGALLPRGSRFSRSTARVQHLPPWANEDFSFRSGQWWRCGPKAICADAFCLAFLMRSAIGTGKREDCL